MDAILFPGRPIASIGRRLPLSCLNKLLLTEVDQKFNMKNNDYTNTMGEYPVTSITRLLFGERTASASTGRHDNHPLNSFGIRVTQITRTTRRLVLKILESSGTTEEILCANLSAKIKGF